ncbi:MAG: MarR family transcriptional regulator [Lachnospiraceae bacterium]|nr:MarR family transcriptional regulator [Lachnospiraceae bacterium]
MTIEDVTNNEKVDFTGIPSSYYLLGLISAFENRFQAMADSTMKEISWKQFFAIICINMCKEPPILKELSDVLGSSHQNVKQILIKLEKKNFIEFKTDEKDKRKQRIVLTDQCREFCEKNDEMSIIIMNRMFNGIPEKDILTTIQTIIGIEKNMKGIIENE